jgi:hypothetical protein
MSDLATVQSFDSPAVADAPVSAPAPPVEAPAVVSNDDAPTNIDAPTDAPVDAPVDAEPALDPNAAEAIAEMFDLEHDGQTYQVPAALKESFMKNADYTQKTQTFASERKQIEDGLKAEFENVQRQRGYVEQMATGKMLEARLSQYENIDWAGWAAQDPAAAQKHQVIANDLRSQYQNVQQQIADGMQAEQNQTARAQQLAMVSAQAEITKAIPDWGTEVAQRLTKFGTEVLNIPTETLNTMNAFPWAVRALHMAEAQHRAIGSAQPMNQPKPTATPVSSTRGSAKTAKTASEMSTKEWMKFRNKQVGM